MELDHFSAFITGERAHSPSITTFFAPHIFFSMMFGANVIFCLYLQSHKQLPQDIPEG